MSELGKDQSTPRLSSDPFDNRWSLQWCFVMTATVRGPIKRLRCPPFFVPRIARAISCLTQNEAVCFMSASASTARRCVGTTKAFSFYASVQYLFSAQLGVVLSVWSRCARLTQFLHNLCAHSVTHFGTEPTFLSHKKTINMAS